MNININLHAAVIEIPCDKYSHKMHLKKHKIPCYTFLKYIHAHGIFHIETYTLQICNTFHPIK